MFKKKFLVIIIIIIIYTPRVFIKSIALLAYHYESYSGTSNTSHFLGTKYKWLLIGGDLYTKLWYDLMVMYHKAIAVSICSPWSVVQHGSLDLLLQCFLLDCRASFYRLEQIEVAEIRLCIIIESEICLRIIIETKITELKGKSIEFEGEIRLCVIIESEIKE